LRSTLCEEDIVNRRSYNIIHSSDIFRDAFTCKRNAQRVSIASSADNLLEDSLGSITGVNVDGLIFDKIRIKHTRNDFSKEGNGFLMELLGISNVAEGDFIERIF
jgi:hypothetical protein